MTSLKVIPRVTKMTSSVCVKFEIADESTSVGLNNQREFQLLSTLLQQMTTTDVYTGMEDEKSSSRCDPSYIFYR